MEEEMSRELQVVDRGITPEVIAVVKWVKWDDAMPKPEAMYTDLHERALIAYIRRHGIRMDGFDHQDARNVGTKGVPVFSDGARLECSMRSWGDLMDDAWSEKPMEMGYCAWAWDIPPGVERKLPPQD